MFFRLTKRLFSFSFRRFIIVVIEAFLFVERSDIQFRFAVYLPPSSYTDSRRIILSSSIGVYAFSSKDIGRYGQGF